jgi:hypothetical protein
MANGPVEAGLALLMATFRAELDTYQVRAYQRALQDVPADVVLLACDHLIDQAAAGRKFYPTPTAPEWKQACAVVIETKRRKAFRLGTSGCEHPSFMESYKDDAGVQWTRRCECYKLGKQLMEAAGVTLALPAWNEPGGGEP